MTWQFFFPRQLTFLAMKQKMRAVPVQRFGVVFKILAHTHTHIFPCLRRISSLLTP